MACLHLEGSFQYIALHCCLTIRPNSLGQDARVLSTWRRTSLSLLLFWIDIYMIPDSLQATLPGTARNIIYIHSWDLRQEQSSSDSSASEQQSIFHTSYSAFKTYRHPTMRYLLTTLVVAALSTIAAAASGKATFLRRQPLRGNLLVHGLLSSLWHLRNRLLRRPMEQRRPMRRLCQRERTQR